MTSRPENNFVQLRQLIDDCFNLDDLRSLCLDLGIDYEHLREGGKPVKINELLLFCARDGREQELLTRLAELRRHVDWPTSYSIPVDLGNDKYGKDIEQLVQVTKRSVKLTFKYSRIRVGPEDIPINRHCTEALRNVVEQGSIVVVGEPGVGKSGALHELIKGLTDDDYDVVFMTVDSLGANSLRGISAELGLSHDIVEVLANWLGTQPAFFVIDALDAARSGPLAHAVNELIALVMHEAKRWRVIASIRKFDLRYGQEISELFAGVPPTNFQDPEFTRVRHINIPLLVDEELRQISERSPLLHQLITAAPETLKDLLRIPFTLNLAGELLASGVDTDELIAIHAQIELLEKYWQKQVVRSDAEGDAREALLRQVTELMVSQQTLRIGRSRVDLAHAASGLLKDLLSCQILTEWYPPSAHKPERAVLTFQHHILYDYAIARLLLRGTNEDFVSTVSRQKHWTLTIRQSLVLHFQYLWQLDATRHYFWEAALSLAASMEVPAIGKIIAPGVAVELAAEISDLEPLLAELFSSNAEKKEVARYELRHTIGILGTETADAGHLMVGEGAGPWSILAQRLSEKLSPEVTFLTQQLLSVLLEQPDLLTRSELYACGTAARRLLTFAWNQPMRNGWLVKRALEAVCRTFVSDHVASARLIRRALEQQHLEEFGFEEMPELAEEILAIIPFDPGLVAEIYKAVFEHQETSRKETFYGGQIMSLVSNRAQDYEGALFRLSEAFPHFLKRSAGDAIQALIAILETYAKSRTYGIMNRGLTPQSFVFRGQKAVIARDYSATWDSDLYRHDYPVKMLESFSNYIDELAKNARDDKSLQEIIDLIGRYNHLAVLWKRLLISGRSFPQRVGLAIKSLAWTVPLLVESDTVNETAKFISAIYPFLSKQERKQVEQTILSITEVMEGNRAGPLRDFLLQNIPQELLVSATAKQALAEKTSIEPESENLSPPLDLPNWLNRVERMDLRAKASQAEIQILDMVEQVKGFTHKARNVMPSEQDSQDVFVTLRDLMTSLTRISEVNSEISELATNSIIEACESVARMDEVSCDSEMGEFVREILLTVAKHYKPIYNPEHDESFDEHPSWGVPAPRVSAANGLILLARHQDCTNNAVQDAIKKLSTDVVPAVRLQIARNCNTLYDSTPPLMWHLIEQFSVQEQSKGVLQALLSHPFWRLRDAELDRIVEATITIFDRVTEGSGANRVRELCARLFLHAYLMHNHKPSYQTIMQIIEKPVEHHDAAQRILLNLRDPLSIASSIPENARQNQMRNVALELFTLLVRAIRHEIDHFNQSNPQLIFGDLSSDEQEQARHLARLVNTIGTGVFFASGAFAEKDHKRNKRTLTKAEKQRFLDEFEPIFDELVPIAGSLLFGYGFGNMTHRTVEVLESLIPANPSQVFYWLGRFILASKKSGYQYESLAATRIVNLIRIYLAQYREIVQQEHQDSLIEVLDVFVDAGWREAIQLTYRLDDVFR